MTTEFDILIIGAGACGLMTAKELSAKGKKVMVLEARNRTGGRIHTINGDGFLQSVDTGPEFIHGNLPVTLQLLQKARIAYTKTEGEMMRNTGGKWHEEEQIEGWNKLMKKMKKLKEDTTLSLFLNEHFSEEKYSALRQQALQYAQGFDAVDPDKASVLSLSNEWQHEEGATYHIDGGYVRLVDALVASCLENDCLILLNKAVTDINWKEGEAKVTTTTGETFTAKQVIITVPLGVLQAGEDEKGVIRFSPSLTQVQQALQNIGYGNVIKILLQFSHPFWQEQKDALFFFSDQTVATWWTQNPSPYAMLTGWIAGKKAASFRDVNDEEMLQISLQSIAGIFGKFLEEIKQMLTASHIINWEKDAYAKGAYSYNMIGSEEAKKTLREPVAGTLYFAGEGLYSGISGGTVEAALVQGLEVAKKVLKK